MRTMAADDRYRNSALFHHARAEFAAVMAVELARLRNAGLSEGQAFRELLQQLPMRGTKATSTEITTMCTTYSLSKGTAALGVALRPAATAAMSASGGSAVDSVKHLCCVLRQAGSRAGHVLEDESDDVVLHPVGAAAPDDGGDSRKRGRGPTSAMLPPSPGMQASSLASAHRNKRPRREDTHSPATGSG